eukprot:223541-Pleurochrysis_carterae.AAC.1
MAQAGRRWQRTLFPWLLDYGFSPSSSDPCVFTLRSSSSDEKLILGCYVDVDLFILPRLFRGVTLCELYRRVVRSMECGGRGARVRLAQRRDPSRCAPRDTLVGFVHTAYGGHFPARRRTG